VYKLILTHEVLPGKLAAIEAWFKEQDRERKKRNPEYTPYRRYITVFGNVHRLVVEAEMEKLPEDPWVFAEGPPSKAGAVFHEMIVPGRTELTLLKELELDS
jgi:hypothetical protein